MPLISWAAYARYVAKKSAKEEVGKVAPEMVRAYLDEKLPGMLAEAIAPLATQVSTNNAEEQAEQLSEKSR